MSDMRWFVYGCFLLGSDMLFCEVKERNNFNGKGSIVISHLYKVQVVIAHFTVLSIGIFSIKIVPFFDHH